MAYEERPGSGTLFRNDDAENPKAPAYKGTLCLLTGEVIRIAGWVKEGKKGKFLSLSIDKPRHDDNRVPTPTQSPRTYEPDHDDEIPF